MNESQDNEDTNSIYETQEDLNHPFLSKPPSTYSNYPSLSQNLLDRKDLSNPTFDTDLFCQECGIPIHLCKLSSIEILDLETSSLSKLSWKKRVNLINQQVPIIENSCEHVINEQTLLVKWKRVLDANGSAGEIAGFRGMIEEYKKLLKEAEKQKKEFTLGFGQVADRRRAIEFELEEKLCEYEARMAVDMAFAEELYGRVELEEGDWLYLL